jgi:tyrosyl-tRNA synthetase
MAIILLTNDASRHAGTIQGAGAVELAVGWIVAGCGAPAGAELAVGGKVAGVGGLGGLGGAGALGRWARSSCGVWAAGRRREIKANLPGSPSRLIPDEVGSGAERKGSGVSSVLEELKWRGLLANSTDEAALAEHLAAGPVTFYVGFDPTAASIHFGNLVQLIVARILQRAGHRPLILVGGSTGLIGDPKESSERLLNSPEVVSAWVKRIRCQVERYVDFEGVNGATVVNNLDWTGPMSALDFLRDVGKHFPVNRMLARDVVRSRLEEGISYTEFSYVLLQALDYLELFRTYSCTLQFGGSDQWGNITAGVELVRRSEGARVHALATPLLTKADGTKFGKTEGGTIWLDPDMTSPYAFHQFFLNAEDAKVIDYLKVFSPRGQEEIDELERQTQQRPHLRLAQRALADDVTALVHSPAERDAAVAAAEALFGRSELADLSESTLASVVAEIGSREMEATDELPSVVDVLHSSGVVTSKSAARRAIVEGGAYLNNIKVTDPDARLSSEQLLHGRFVVARRGKKTVGATTIKRKPLGGENGVPSP